MVYVIVLYAYLREAPIQGPEIGKVWERYLQSTTILYKSHVNRTY